MTNNDEPEIIDTDGKTPELIFHPEVIPDKVTEFINNKVHENSLAEKNRKFTQRNHAGNIRQQRILNTDIGEYHHGINLILLYAERALNQNTKVRYPDNGTTFSIKYSLFNFTDGSFFELFLDKLQEEKCFESWKKNPFQSADQLEYVFQKVSIQELTKLRFKYESKSPKRTLKFSQKTGKATYTDNDGKTNEFIFRPDTNPFRLLTYFAQFPQTQHQYNVLAQKLKEPRSGGEDSLPERRVTDTVTAIKKHLNGVPFVTSKGYMLDCPAQLETS